MGGVFYVLAIMGCGDGQADCREVRAEPVRFATAAQCRAAMPLALRRHTDIDYPVVSAACRADGPVMVRAAATPPRG